MDIQKTILFLQSEGYEHIKQIPGIGLCGLKRMAFTTGLFCNMDEEVYGYRYCFHSYREALKSLNEWDGVGDAPGNWIKRKGYGVDKSNPNYNKEDADIGYSS